MQGMDDRKIQETKKVPHIDGTPTPNKTITNTSAKKTNAMSVGSYEPVIWSNASNYIIQTRVK